MKKLINKPDGYDALMYPSYTLGACGSIVDELLEGLCGAHPSLVGSSGNSTKYTF
jgi:hypothetical protein